MPEQLRDRLEAARKRLFVGRQEELALFRSLLTSEESSTSVLYVYGPGGIGKTTLLREYQGLAQKVMVPAYYLNADFVDSSPSGFMRALRKTMDLEPTASPIALLQESEDRFVLLVDSYGGLASLERWLQEEFLPALPATTLIVLASRNPPSRHWRAHLGWQSIMQVIGLRNLTPQEAEQYLSRQRVPAERRQVAVSLTHGFPLALSLLADTYHEQPSAPFSLDAASDVIPSLLERFLENVPGPAHRTALEASAVVRSLNEALLSTLLDMPDVHDLFNWLAGLSLMELQADGLSLHALPRTVISTHLRWRNPDWYEELGRRARSYYRQRVEKSRGAEQQATVIDYMYLHRHSPILKPFFSQLQQARQGDAVASVDNAGADDWSHLQEMVLRHEGEHSAALLGYWADHEAQTTIVYRDENGHPLGFLLIVALDRCTSTEEQRDPAIEQARTFLQNHAPLRAGETASLFRYWMAGETYQEISPTQSLIGVDMVRHYLTTANLAYSFMPCANPDLWYVICTYADLVRIPEADFAVGGHDYGVYGHDWRQVPVTVWLELLAEREGSRSPTLTERSEIVEPRRTLSRPEFEAAVLEALRSYPRIDKLQANPLLRSRLIMGRLESDAGERDRVDALQMLLKEVADQVLNTARSRKYYRALYHTYLQPAPTQEKAAEIINVPYGTFRRHLKRAIAQLTDALWQQEIGAG